MKSRSVVCAFSALFLGACELPSPPLPPLLKNATGGGGGNYLCSASGIVPYGGGDTPDTVAHSREIVERLKSHFPPGSPSGLLEASLRSQGFSLSRCEHDESLGIALFNQTGGDGILHLSASASVYWKVDEAGRIEWSTGNITFRGL